MENDLIICSIANYDIDKISVYVKSLNNTTYSGDKIMLCSNIDTQTIIFLKQYGWECYNIDYDNSQHPHMKRLIYMWHFLSLDNRSWRYIITTDVRDIYWQINPSEWLTKNLKKPILCASENVLYKNEPWGIKNIHEGYGEFLWSWISEKEIGNVGVIAGEYIYVRDLLLLNYMVSQSGDTQHFTDQSSFNIVIHNELIKDKIDINNSFALQVGTLDNDTNDIQYSLGDNITTMLNEPFVLIHQYDRNELLHKHVMNKMQ